MRSRRVALAVLALLVATASPAFAHGVSLGDKGYIQATLGVRLVPFLYLGAKHMVTGYDHLLFLCGVIFYLYRLRDIATYVSLFAVGHSSTLLLGVLAKISVDPYLIDAIIGFSVAYKALDNVGALKRWLGVQPDARAATFVFGLFHGFGLATKLLDFQMDPNGLVANLLAFNVGVELGQLLALTFVLIGISYWRRSASFERGGFAANMVLFAAGLALVGYQVSGYVANRSASVVPSVAASRTDSITVTIAPEKRVEVKLVMKQGARATFDWATDGEEVGYNVHGEPLNDPTAAADVYDRGTANAKRGEIIAAFDGIHGWAFRNISETPVTIRVHATGQFSEIRRLH